MLSEQELAAAVVAAYKATGLKPLFNIFYTDAVHGQAHTEGGCALTALARAAGKRTTNGGGYQEQHARHAYGVDATWLSAFISGFEGRATEATTVPGASHGLACRNAVLAAWPEVRPVEVTSGAACVVSPSLASARPELPCMPVSTQKVGTP